MRAGSEVHVDLHYPGVVSRRSVREALAPVLEEFGFATTRTEHWDARSRRFVEAIGFEPSWSDDAYQYFILTKKPFSKEQ
jgi:hypothetical protein